MSTPVELLRARQKRIMLQRRQLELELEAAQLEEEILMLTANRHNAVYSATTSAENAVYHMGIATARLRDLSETRGQGQDEERMFSTNAKVDNTRMPLLADSNPIKSSADFGMRTDADEAQIPPTISRKVATETGHSTTHDDRKSLAQRYVTHFGQSQPQISILPTINPDPKSLETNADVHTGAVDAQHSSPTSRNHTQPPNFYIPPVWRTQFHKPQDGNQHAVDTSVHTGAVDTQQVLSIPRDDTRSPSFFLPLIWRTQSHKPQDGNQLARNLPSALSPAGNSSYLEQSVRDPSPQLDHIQLQNQSIPSPENLPIQVTGSADATSSPCLRDWRSQQASRQHENTQLSELHYPRLESQQPAVQDARPSDKAHSGASMIHLRDRSTEAGQSSFNSPSLQQGATSSPENVKATPGGFQASRQPQGLGICALKKKTVLPTQAKRSVLPASGESQGENLQSISKADILDTKMSRKRSSSITVTDVRSTKRRAGEHARVVTPPLNEDGERKVREDNTEQRPPRTYHQQQQTQPRSPSGSQYSYHSSRTPSIDSRSESDESNQIESPRQEQHRKRKTSMQQRIVPQITPQAYTLHLQDRSHEYNISSLIHPRPPPNPRPARQTGTAHSENVTRPSNHQQIRQRSGLPCMLPSSNQEPRYRRLTPPERAELEIRYCAHLARLLCNNTCVSSPPLPLCDENLWTRLHRRFPPQPGRPLPPRFDADEVYANAADFEVDVKAMLRQYVVLGHCGEQAQNQGQGRIARVMRCEFEKTGNARVMCWRMRLESILDEKLRQLKPVLRECEESYEAEDMEGKRSCIDATFAGVSLGD